MPFILPVLGAIGAAAGVTGAGVTAATSIAAGTIITGTVASGAMSAYGAYQQGQAQKNMMNYQAQAAAVQQHGVTLRSLFPGPFTRLTVIRGFLKINMPA